MKAPPDSQVKPGEGEPHRGGSVVPGRIAGWSPRFKARIAGVFEVLEATGSAGFMTPLWPERSQQLYARVAGLMYFFTVFDVSGVLIIARIRGSADFLAMAHAVAASETLYRIGLILGLIGTLSTIALTVALYAVLRPVDRTLAMAALLFRTAETVVTGVVVVLGFVTLQIYLDAAATGAPADRLSELSRLASTASQVGTNVSVVFFAVGSTLFFVLFLRSAYIPRLLAIWGLIGSIICFISFVASLIVGSTTELVTGIGGLPVGVAEPVVGAWLLFRGIGQTQGAQSLSRTGDKDITAR